MTTLLKVLKWLFGLLLALLILAFALLAGGANPIINTQLTTLSELMSEELGRPLKVERVDVRAFPSVVLALNNVTLGEVQGSNWSARRASLSPASPTDAPSRAVAESASGRDELAGPSREASATSAVFSDPSTSSSPASRSSSRRFGTRSLMNSSRTSASSSRRWKSSASAASCSSCVRRGMMRGTSSAGARRMDLASW